jgi:hypothetical protein
LSDWFSKKFPIQKAIDKKIEIKPAAESSKAPEMPKDEVKSEENPVVLQQKFADKPVSQPIPEEKTTFEEKSETPVISQPMERESPSL